MIQIDSLSYARSTRTSLLRFYRSRTYPDPDPWLLHIPQQVATVRSSQVNGGRGSSRGGRRSVEKELSGVEEGLAARCRLCTSVRRSRNHYKARRSPRESPFDYKGNQTQSHGMHEKSRIDAGIYSCCWWHVSSKSTAETGGREAVDLVLDVDQLPSSVRWRLDHCLGRSISLPVKLQSSRNCLVGI
jgi:hypothetical protein